MADDDGIREARERMALGALEGLIRAAEDLLGRAQRLAPVAEGTLRGSAALTIVVNGTRYEGAGAKIAAQAAVRASARGGRGTVLEAEVSFSTVYAARQHEELGWAHPKGGQAKYLDTPLRAQAARYDRIIAAAASRGL